MSVPSDFALKYEVLVAVFLGAVGSHFMAGTVLEWACSRMQLDAGGELCAVMWCRFHALQVIRAGVELPPLPLWEKACYLVGRVPICDFVLENDTVSRQHAVFQHRHEPFSQRGVVDFSS